MVPPAMVLPRPSFHRSKSDDANKLSGECRHTSFFLDNTLPVEYFKQDIVKLTHSLHIPKWNSMVEKHMAKDIIVNRISGALTNAVYAVEPPKYMRDKKSGGSERTAPPKLLLRVYGPQVVHLIDRKKELSVLARLSAKHIGPRLLGTFSNGRFEQFLTAKTLTKEDIRDPDTSAQIAKRMRELHDGVPLIEEERNAGPGVWLSINKWSARAREKMEMLEAKQPGSTLEVLQARTWDEFCTTIDKFREYLTSKYGGSDTINKSLVFSHNDTQYGNILRLEPPKGSPLLRPQNEHRQLIVIDFEYSSANPRAYDIANHFCEWMADYHHPSLSYHIYEDWYPTRQQQLNLVREYVEHGIEMFDDDAELTIQMEVDRLMEQIADWRSAVHAYWCVWGLVQAVVDVEADMKTREQLDQESGSYVFTTNKDDNDNDDDDGDNDEARRTKIETANNDESDNVEEIDEQEDVFDYVRYSAEKAQLFWTEMIRLGLVKPEEYSGTLKHINDNLEK